MDIGPFELIVLVFPGSRADPAAVEVLSGVVSRGYVTVLDLVFIARTSDGRFRITNAEENLHDIGLGSLEIRARPLISENELDVVRGTLQPGTSAAVIAYEHSWARRLAGTVTSAGGTVAHVQVPREAVEAAAAATPRAGQRRRFAGYANQAQVVAESEAAVREAEAEAAAAERAAEKYATFEPRSAAHDDLASRLGELANLRDSGALTQEEYESAKSKLLGP